MTCVWTPDENTLEENGWSDYDPDQQERALLLASSSLVNLTYGRVGTCPITIRPCPDTPQCPCWRWDANGIPSYPPFIPYMGLDGNWYNQTCGHRLGCKPLSEIDIPGPVGYIESFKINGVEQVTDENFYTNWRLDDGHLLVWQGFDGEDPDNPVELPSPVPSSQNLNLPDSQPGTWSITYSRSYPVLEDGQIAVAFLALEFAKAIKPSSKKCGLPRGVTSVVRNGVSFTIEAGLFPGGLTSIEAVDQYILKWAPGGSPRVTAQVFDPAKYQQGPRRTNSVPRKAV